MLVTYKDIARRAKVSRTTVHLALTNSPQLPASTRERIRKVADRLGYVPNPLASAFQSEVRRGREAKFRCTLGWLSDHPAPFWGTSPYGKALWESAMRRAASQGYHLDVIPVELAGEHVEQGSVDAALRIMRAHGIPGAIIPQPVSSDLNYADWREMAIILLSTHTLYVWEGLLRQPGPLPYHTVRPDYAENVSTLMAELGRLGYRRPGLVLSRWMDAQSDGQERAMFLVHAAALAGGDAVPVYFHEVAEAVAPDSFRDWLRRYKPDVVVCRHFETRGWIEQSGLRIPADIGLAHLALGHLESGWSGMDPRLGLLAEAAVDMLTAHLQRNERGRPPYVKDLLISGVWTPGTTVRRAARKQRERRR